MRENDRPDSPDRRTPRRFRSSIIKSLAQTLAYPDLDRGTVLKTILLAGLKSDLWNEKDILASKMDFPNPHSVPILHWEKATYVEGSLNAYSDLLRKDRTYSPTETIKAMVKDVDKLDWDSVVVVKPKAVLIDDIEEPKDSSYTRRFRKRAQEKPPNFSPDTPLPAGYSLDSPTMILVSPNGKIIKLFPREFAVFQVISQNPDHFTTRQVQEAQSAISEKPVSLNNTATYMSVAKQIIVALSDLTDTRDPRHPMKSRGKGVYSFGLENQP